MKWNSLFMIIYSGAWRREKSRGVQEKIFQKLRIYLENFEREKIHLENFKKWRGAKLIFSI
jgi:hypothetical protein